MPKIPSSVYPGETKLFFDAAEDLGLRPEWILPDELFRVTSANGPAFVHQNYSRLNPRHSASLTQDKLISRIILGENELPNIPYIGNPTLAEAQAFLGEHGKVVAKPRLGSDSRDIHIIDTPDVFARLNPLDDYLLERFVSGPEMRYLAINGDVVAVHERRWADGPPGPDRSAKRISLPESQWDPELVEATGRVAAIFELGCTAVDYLAPHDEQAAIVEVNSLPSLYPFHYPAEGPAVPAAHIIMKQTFGRA